MTDISHNILHSISHSTGSTSTLDSHCETVLEKTDNYSRISTASSLVSYTGTLPIYCFLLLLLLFLLLFFFFLLLFLLLLPSLSPLILLIYNLDFLIVVSFSLVFRKQTIQIFVIEGIFIGVFYQLIQQLQRWKGVMILSPCTCTCICLSTISLLGFLLMLCLKFGLLKEF